MGKTNAKGEIGEAIILADLQRQGHGIAIPFGHDLPFDLIVVRKENGALEKVQCKYTTSNGRVDRGANHDHTSAWVHSSIHQRRGRLDRRVRQRPLISVSICLQ